MDGRVESLCEKAIVTGALSESECIEMLGFDELSEEADKVISTAYRAVRSRTGNACSLGAQIGVITGPCIADCGFCGFAASTTDADEYVMPARVLRGYLEYLTRYDDLESVSLMTIHNFDFEDLMDAVDIAVETVPGHVAVCVNTGDVTAEEARELRDAGVRRAYHSLRIDEGDDTLLNPLDRFNTIGVLNSAGMETVSCVEPIGPEHPIEDIVSRFFGARRMGCGSCSVGRRVSVPGTRMQHMGEISPRRLEQIRSVLMLSSLHDGFYGGYYGGFDKDYAEYAGSPRDVADYSEKSNGNTIEIVRRRFFERGVDHIRCGDGRMVRLDEEYLRTTGS